MARVETVSDSESDPAPQALGATLEGISIASMRQFARAKATREASESTLRPSQVPAAGGKPLVELGVDDLRAAGVTFTEVGEEEDEEEEGAGDESDGALGDDEDDLRSDEERAAEAWWDEFFDGLMYTVPCSFLYLMLDILTHLSYQSRPEFSFYAKNYFVALITLGVIIFHTSRHHKSEIVRAILLVASFACGARLIWLVNKASYLVVMRQAPAMGTIWILTIIQLPLERAVAALAAVAAWGYATGMRIKP